MSPDAVVFSNQQMDDVLERIDSLIDVKISAAFWKIVMGFSVPILGFAIAWGTLYSQVQGDHEIISNKVLTVQDKENFQHQIEALSTQISAVSIDVRDIKRVLLK